MASQPKQACVGASGFDRGQRSAELILFQLSVQIQYGYKCTNIVITSVTSDLLTEVC